MPKVSAPKDRTASNASRIRARSRAGLGRGNLLGQAFPHAHHLLHEATVELIAGQHRDEPVPVVEVVVHPPAHEPEHAAEHVGPGFDRFLRHAYEPTELLIHALVGAPRERECERRRDAAVALDDVRVVPQRAAGVRVGRLAERGDRTALEKKELAATKGPLNVLGAAEVRFGTPREIGHLLDLSIRQRRRRGALGRHGHGAHALGRRRIGAMHRVLHLDGALDDLADPVHPPRVGYGFARDECAAQPRHGADDHDRAASRDRVGAECDPGGLAVDHSLDDDCRSTGQRIEARFVAVTHQPLAEPGRPDLNDPRRHVPARDEQDALELPGEREPGAVLLERGGADREARVALRQPCHGAIDLGCDRVGEPRVENVFLHVDPLDVRRPRWNTRIERRGEHDEPTRNRQVGLVHVRQRAGFPAHRARGLDFVGKENVFHSFRSAAAPMRPDQAPGISRPARLRKARETPSRARDADRSGTCARIQPPRRTLRRRGPR